MAHNFDEVINRRESSSLKWDRYGPDVLPMWVADMDFESPAAVMEALSSRTAHGIFGYGMVPAELQDATVERLYRRYGWRVPPDSLVWLPALVPALNLACRAFVPEGGAVMTAMPIYPPFLSAPINQGRGVVRVPTTMLPDGSWRLDPGVLAASASADAGMFMFCNPHNPIGKAYSRDEVIEVVDFCREHGLVLCSDEIHCDLLLEDGIAHVPAATVADDCDEFTITLMSPSKTFNMPGLECSFAVIPNAALRRRFKCELRGLFHGVNVMGSAACLAAFRCGDEWLAELLVYLRANRDLFTEFVASELPKVRMGKIEATYLAWLDVRTVGVESPWQALLDAGLALSDGRDFGAPGFVRLNFGCPRSRLLEGLEILKRVLA